MRHLPTKILVIGPAWVGDMVMSQALFKLLKAHNPHVVIDVLAPAWTHPLLARMPEINQAIVMPFKHGEFNFKARWALGKKLRAEGYEQAIILPNSWKSALVPFAARIPLRTGWLGEVRFGLLNDVRYLDKKKCPLMVQRLLMLGLSRHEMNNVVNEKQFRPALQTSEQKCRETYQKFKITERAKKIIAFCPGAEFGSSKRWPAEHFVSVAKQKIAEGCEVWLFGSEKDQPISEKIQLLVQGACRDFVGKTSLGEAVDLLSLADVVVTNDSGLMHVAASLDRPMVVLYGSSSPDFTPPLSERVKILSLHLSCSPCFQRECPLGHWKCLRDLSPDLVLEAMNSL